MALGPKIFGLGPGGSVTPLSPSAASGGPSLPGGLGGLGPLMGCGGGEPAKKFTSKECLEAALEAVGAEPTLIRNQIQVFTSDQADLLNKTLWPAVFEEDNWERTSTRRPSVDNEGNALLATDREVRTYENNAWYDAGKALDVVVTSEHGEITEVKFTAKW